MNQKILIIDDSHTLAKSLELFLRPQGFMVQIAHDGMEGIEAVKSFQPNLIFLDIEMPGMNGFETLVEIKKMMNQDYAVPIIMLSANNSPNDVIRSIKNGAQDYILKPFDELRMQEKLHKYLKK